MDIGTSDRTRCKGSRMIVSTETLQRFVGGQVEVQNSIEGYLYRGEIRSAAVDGHTLAIQLAWTARGEGFPPVPSHWTRSARNAFDANLKLYSVQNIGPGPTGSDRLYLSSLDGKEIAVLFPPDGSRLPEPP